MKIIKIGSKNINLIINKTIKTLKSGGLVVFPSDTVYGLLCDAENENAVKKLIKFKNRPPGKAISVFCSLKLIDRLVKINPQQQKIIREILPGPFTVVLPSKHRVSKLLESESETLGVRIPMYRYIEVLVNRFKKPITATSANLTGSSPHYSIKSLLNELSEKQRQQVNLIIDAGDLPRNKPSTVIDLSESDIKVLRRGDINFLKKSETFVSKTSEETKRIAKKIFQSYRKGNTSSMQNKPLIFIIEGEMGVGKTVFVKGIGEQLRINNIISPTFVIYYEYDIKYPAFAEASSYVKTSSFVRTSEDKSAGKQKSKMIHVDLYNIENKDEFTRLGLEKLLKPGHVLCFEWGEKAGEIIDLLQKKGKIVYVRMKYVDEIKRKIEVKN